MSGDFQPIISDGGVRHGSYKNVALAIWGRTVSGDTTQALAAQNRLLAHVSAKYPDEVVMIVVVAQGAQVPNSAQRKELESFFQHWTPSLRALSQVVEGSDLWAVTCRSIMTAMSLVQRRPYPNKMFATVPEGAHWLAEYMPKGSGQSPADMAREIENAVEALRTQAL